MNTQTDPSLNSNNLTQVVAGLNNLCAHLAQSNARMEERQSRNDELLFELINRLSVAPSAAPVAQKQSNAGGRVPTSCPTFADLPEDDIDIWLTKVNAQYDGYNTPDHKRLEHVITFLEGPAFHWFRKLQRDSSSKVASWKAFNDSIRLRFPKSRHKPDLMTSFLAMKQETRSINEYIAEFSDLCEQLEEVNDFTKIHVFAKGLNDKFIKGQIFSKKCSNIEEAFEIARDFGNDFDQQIVDSSFVRSSAHKASVPVPDQMELDNLNVKYAFCRCCGVKGHLWRECNCGHRQCKRRQKRKSYQKKTFEKFSTKKPHKVHFNNLHADESNSVQSCSDSSFDSSSDNSDPNDAHLNNINITYDNNSSISATICSLDPCDSSSLSFNSSLSNSRLIKLKGKMNKMNVDILLDCGATHNFMSSDIAKVLGCKLTPLANHIVVHGASASKNIGSISHIALNVDYRINKYCNSDNFYVLPNLKHNIVFGIPWLKKHNPSIDWLLEKIVVSTASGPFCLKSNSSSISSMSLSESNLCLLTLPQFQQQNSSDITECFALYPSTIDNNFEQTSHINSVSLQPRINQCCHGSPEFNAKLAPLLLEFAHVFKDPEHLPPERDIDHEINTGDASPQCGKVRRSSPLENAEIKKQIDVLLSKGFIRPSKSSWGAPVLFAHKKDGTLRFCIDYRALNHVTVKDKNAIPRIDVLLESFSEAKVFSRIDLKNAYYQVRIKENDIEKTAFFTRYGSFEFLVMPFGLTNAPATFTRLMQNILSDYTDKFVVNYLDDIIIYSKNETEHLHHIKLVLQKLAENQLFAKLEKCAFGTTEIEFVGHIVSVDGIKTDPSKVKAVLEWATPKSPSDITSFLGLIGYYRKFISQFALIAKPLIAAASLKNDQFQWNNACEVSFNHLKQLLVQAPILKIPDYNKPFILQTDASDYALGGVLTQDYNGTLHPIAFESRRLTSAETRYAIHEKEMLAIVHCVKKWLCYIEGAPQVTVLTDHKSLTTVLQAGWDSSNSLSGRRMNRWKEFLSPKNLDIQYRPGPDNVLADALSRQDSPTVTENADQSLGEAYMCSIDNLQQDPFWFQALLNIFHHKENSPSLPSSSVSLAHSKLKDFVFDNATNALFYKRKHRLIPYVPFSFRSDFILTIHRKFGHLRSKSLFEIIEDRGYWPTLKADVPKILETCAACLSGEKKNSIVEPMHPLGPCDIFQRWSLDFIGALPETPSGNKYILVAIEHATNWCVFKPFSNCDSSVVQEFIFKEIILNFGCPQEILTDRGSSFLSQETTHFLQKHNILHLKTSSYHPQTNGKVERLNGVIGTMLTKYVQGDVTNWDKYLNQCLFAARVRFQTFSGYSPFYLLYGTKPRISNDALLFSDQSDSQDTLQRREDLLAQLTLDRKQARLRSDIESIKRKELYDSNLKNLLEPLSRKSIVYLQAIKPKKFEKPWTGPFFISKCAPLGTYQLISPRGQVLETLIHRNRLKPVPASAHPELVYPGDKSSSTGGESAQGYHEYGHRYKESILNQVRIQAEHCDSLQSFFLLQSISGGTGSGLGSFICQTLADEYPDVMRMCVSVFPSVEDVVITSPYNSLLCLDTLVNYADCVFPIENKCLLSICDKMNSIKDAKNTLAGPQKKDKRATFDDMNSIVANLLLNLTCSMRFNGELNVDLNEISSNLVPFPKLHFLLTSMAPLFKPAKLQPLRTDQLFNDLFQREFMLVDTNPKAHTYLASAVICRGNFTLTDIRRSIDKLKRQLRFVDWNQDGWKVGHCSNPSLLSERTVLSISNNTSIASTFEGIESRFLKLYRRKAHLYHYLEFMENDHFDTALDNIQNLIEQYKKYDK